METSRLAAVDAAIKVARDVLAYQPATVSPVEKAFTSMHSTPAASTPVPKDTLLMRVS